MPRIYYNEWGTDEDKRRYLDTLQYANARIEEFVDKVLKETDREPIIIIESDHGTAFDFDWDEPTDKMLKQRFSNLNAYYLPKGGDLLYDNITPVNSFTILFSMHFVSQDPRTIQNIDMHPFFLTKLNSERISIFLIGHSHVGQLN